MRGLEEKNLEKLLEGVIKKITPGEEEKKKELGLARKIIEKIDKMPGKHEKAMLCGSLARDTHLKGERDFDIFVLFNEEIGRKEFEVEGMRIGKKIFKGNECWVEYSEHPYVKGIIEGFEIEIVPCYNVKKACALKSSVDRSPFHKKFLEKKLNEKHKKEIRIFKAFLKGIGCYGADIEKEGVSGYLAELLIIKYETFIQCLKSIEKWTPGKKVGLKKEHLKKCKASASLIFPDPTDPKRNTASALSQEQFARLVIASRAFLSSPNEKFFFKKKKAFSKKQLEKLIEKREIIVLSMPFKKCPKDIVFGQLKRLKEFSAKQFTEKGFRVLNAKQKEVKGKAYLFIELSELRIGENKKVQGPPVFDAKNTEAFLKAHENAVSGPRIEGTRFIAIEKRKEQRAKKVMQNIAKYLSTNGKQPMKSMLKKAKAMEKKEVLKECNNKEFEIALTEFLKGKESFMQ